MRDAADTLVTWAAEPLFFMFLTVALLSPLLFPTVPRTRRWLARRGLAQDAAAVDAARGPLRLFCLTLSLGALPALVAVPYSPGLLVCLPFALYAYAHRTPGAALREGPAVPFHRRPGAAPAAGLVLAVTGLAVAVGGAVPLAYAGLTAGAAVLLLTLDGMWRPVIGAESSGVTEVRGAVGLRLRTAAYGGIWYTLILGARKVCQSASDVLDQGREGPTGLADGLYFTGSALNVVAIVVLCALVFPLPRTVRAVGPRT
ncbi:hypothetical protein [Streptomyces paludis]|uniref:Uncharacterized protein n=1 Tax=Streptomyces paludis TaxID=2282738 RepID=A0A345HMC5_9ACTN|nr:hypothetical protein [Streptomyces paludis]AXG77849.1 hypothetical protein DVK44_09215 [Streptomyces paludis]